MRTGVANLPLHGGKAPAWLFRRMTSLARGVALAVAEEFGPDEMLRRLADPFWFQAFGCALGFDWHSSGVTTTVCGALKEGIRGIEHDVGLYGGGGKGAASRKTPEHITKHCEGLSLDPDRLVYASRMSAKVDSAALQDGHTLYHHAFFFTSDGAWCVVQQGMNEETRYARRYHWYSPSVEDFVCEPHEAVCCDAKGAVLNLVAQESAGARQASTDVVNEPPAVVLNEARSFRPLDLPRHPTVLLGAFESKRLRDLVHKIHDLRPAGFEALLGIPGVGARSIRALCLLGELIYGAAPSTRDPVRYSFAHGGKDGHPFPVDRACYDRSIEFLETCISRARLGQRDKLDALRRLGKLAGSSKARG